MFIRGRKTVSWWWSPFPVDPKDPSMNPCLLLTAFFLTWDSYLWCPSHSHCLSIVTMFLESLSPSLYLSTLVTNWLYWMSEEEYLWNPWSLGRLFLSLLPPILSLYLSHNNSLLDLEWNVFCVLRRKRSETKKILCHMTFVQWWHWLSLREE